jgi:hypothetical protein
MNEASNNIFQLGQSRKVNENPIFAELLTHWEDLRAGRIAPERSEIDPRQIETALPYAFILERMTTGMTTGNARFRIAGLRLCELMGMEIRAMPASAIFAPEARDAYGKLLAGLFETPEIIELRLTSDSAGLTADMLLLPMAGRAGDITRILGCLVADKIPVTPPHRFVISDRKFTRIPCQSGGIYTTPEPAFLTGFAEPATEFLPPPRRRKPHLRLVRSDA